MSEILSAETIAGTRQAALNVCHETPDPFMRGMLAIFDSHEALRTRLDAAQQEVARQDTSIRALLDEADARADAAERDRDDLHVVWKAAEGEVSRLREALSVERSYWQTRSHLARTKTEEVMVDYHLDSIDAALAPLVSQGGPPMSDPILSAEEWLLTLDRFTNGDAATHNAALTSLVMHERALREALLMSDAEWEQVGWMGRFGLIPGGIPDPSPNWEPVYVKRPAPPVSKEDPQ
jgi:hypothetical protein